MKIAQFSTAFVVCFLLASAAFASDVIYSGRVYYVNDTVTETVTLSGSLSDVITRQTIRTDSAGKVLCVQVTVGGVNHQSGQARVLKSVSAGNTTCTYAADLEGYIFNKSADGASATLVTPYGSAALRQLQ